MSPIYVDTSVFVRHFAQDVPGQSEHATDFLKLAEVGATEIVVTESVMLELEHVLTSRALSYQLDRAEMTAALRAILGLAGLRVSSADRFVFNVAVALYEEHPIDFGDALLAARMRQAGVSDLASFDRHHFDWLPEVRRVDLTQFGS